MRAAAQPSLRHAKAVGYTLDRTHGKVRVGRCVVQEAISRESVRKKPFVLEDHRAKEVQKVINHRHGLGTLPETDDVDIYIRALVLAKSSKFDLLRWCQLRAPWILDRWEELVEPIMAEDRGRQYMLSADQVAKLLQVSYAERTRLKLKTIGAFDVSKEKRAELAKEAKRERDRLQKQAQRREEGRVDRATYEAGSVERKEPWKAEGISRRTWYRRRRVTGVSHLEKTTNKLVDTPVTPMQKLAIPPVSRPNHKPPNAVRGGVWGLKSPARVRKGRPLVGAATGTDDPPAQTVANGATLIRSRLGCWTASFAEGLNVDRQAWSRSRQRGNPNHQTDDITIH